MKRLTAISDVGEAYYPYCYRADTCDGEGETEKCRDCKFSEQICKTLAAYENTGLTPEEVEKVKYLEPAVDRMQHIFGTNLTVNKVIDAFVEFYRAEDGRRAAEAVLLVNKKVAEYRKLKERNTAKEPKKVSNSGVRYTDDYVCPSCGMHFTGTGVAAFCYHCGQRLKWGDLT